MPAIYTIQPDRLAFIRKAHPIVNEIYADQILHDIGLRAAIDKARAMATVEPDHMWQGNRYWRTGDIIDAGQAYLAGRA